MTITKILCAATLAMTLGVTSVAAGSATAPAPSTSNNNNTGRDVLIGAAVIGLVIWALGGFGPSSSVGGTVSTQGTDKATGPAKGKVLGRY